MRQDLSSLSQTSLFSRSILGFVRRANVRARKPVVLSGLVLVSMGLVTERASAETISNGGTYIFDGFDHNRDAPPQERVPSRTDGVYGRFDGEVSLSPFVGAAYTQAGMQTELGLGGYYFQTLGLQVKYADGKLFPGTFTTPHSVTTLSLAFRPLFLLRWSENWEQGPSWMDLWLDSLTVKAGGYYSINRDNDARKQGLETEISCGLPLLGRAYGPWVTLAGATRFPKVTHDGSAIDIAASLRLEWAFSLGG
jgi:hypothetical protein